jgi:hypothetical protein
VESVEFCGMQLEWSFGNNCVWSMALIMRVTFNPLPRMAQTARTSFFIRLVFFAHFKPTTKKNALHCSYKAKYQLHAIYFILACAQMVHLSFSISLIYFSLTNIASFRPMMSISSRGQF